MNRFLSGILTLVSIVATMTTASHIPLEGESGFSEVHSQLEERRSLRALNAPTCNTTPSPTRQEPTPMPTDCKTTPSPTIRLPLATRKPTPVPTNYKTNPSPTIQLSLATRKPTRSPTYSSVTVNEPYCLDVDKEVYDCGEPITVFSTYRKGRTLNLLVFEISSGYFHIM
jgi:hypothetical protein